jgi:hypothetical protein
MLVYLDDEANQLPMVFVARKFDSNLYFEDVIHFIAQRAFSIQEDSLRNICHLNPKGSSHKILREDLLIRFSILSNNETITCHL